MKGLSILGSTGSIGRSTLDVVRANPGAFQVISLCAGSNVELLEAQIKEFKPSFVSVEDPGRASVLSGAVACEVGSGRQGACKAASYPGVGITLSAISGSAGLLPTLSAIDAGKDVALANKEALVMAGSVVMAQARAKGVSVLPVDSEHSAVFQALAGHRMQDVKRIVLTASGGPFFGLNAEELSTVTPDEALAHPNWDMGRKITIDSATLLNKGLEVIEAKWLFDLAPDKISVLIHPQSIVHSMVEYIDGSVMAQMGTPDMKGPIAYALSYPERVSKGAGPLNLAGKSLEFFEPDYDNFPCLGLAYRALDAGGTMPAVLNAADEVAVEAFLDGIIPYAGIYQLIAGVMEDFSNIDNPTLDVIIEVDRSARAKAAELLELCYTV